MLKKPIFMLLIILIPLILFSANLRDPAFSPDFYETQFDKYQPDINNSMEITRNLIYYLQNPCANKTFILGFSTDEQLHLKDVQNLFLLNAVVLASAVLLFIIFLSKAKKHLHLILIFGGILTAVLAVMFAILARNFVPAFNLFHRIFFSQNWQFPETSLLITLFPMQFFTAITKRIITNIFMCSAVTIIAGIVLYLFRKPQP